MNYTTSTPINKFRDNIDYYALWKAFDQLSPYPSPLSRESVMRAFVDNCRLWNIDQVYLLAHAILESAWGTSNIATQKNNLFGYMAYDSDPFNSAKPFPNFEEAIAFQAKFVSTQYLTSSGKFYGGSPTLSGMNKKYATSKTWADSIARIATALSNTIESQPATQPMDVPVKATSIVVTAPKGVNVRTSPYTTGTLVGGIKTGAEVDVIKVVTGENVNGNDQWYLLKTATPQYVWSGAVQVIGVLPEAPQEPTLELAVAPSTTDSNLEIETLNRQINQLQETINEKNRKINELTEQIGQKNIELAQRSNQGNNSAVLTNVNKELSDAVEKLNEQLNDARKTIFAGWGFDILPKDSSLMQAFSVALKLKNISRDDQLVVGWKVGGRLEKA